MQFIKMKILVVLWVFLLTCVHETHSQGKLYKENVTVQEVNNSLFTGDKYWRGADGAATINLGKNKILWLFGDTFIDTIGTGKRTNSTIIRNSIAIQEGEDFESAFLTFYYKGIPEKPKAFFELPGSNWFWPGHGTVVKDKLIIFLFELESTNEGFGFQSVGWHLAIVKNPSDDPMNWDIEFFKGPDPSGILVGSSAVLKDDKFVYAYGVKEPGTHEVYLIRFEVGQLLTGNFSSMAWWSNNHWVKNEGFEPENAVLFTGHTEFSVHYQKEIESFMQIQSFGFGQAELGYRLASQPQGPWSEPVIFYKPKFVDNQEFMYSAKAHPELTSEGIIITYNINNFDFGKLVHNEEIYFPRIIKLDF